VCRCELFGVPDRIAGAADQPGGCRVDGFEPAEGTRQTPATPGQALAAETALRRLLAEVNG
jgi:hypothetical protein